MPGVTSGSIQADLRDLAVPDSASGTVDLEFGRAGERGGRRANDVVLWSAAEGWRSVPEDCWNFTACGFQVLPKWLSYRKNKGLTATDREAFRIIVRRVYAVLAEADACNTAYRVALATPLLATGADPSTQAIPSANPG